MTKYRDLLTKEESEEIGDIVGNGLDRANRNFSWYEITRAICFYKHYKEQINEFPIGARREAIKDFVADFSVPNYLSK